MKGVFFKGLRWGGLCLITLLIPARTMSGPKWPFGDSSPYDTLMNTYGEFQPEYGWYMHGGIDICAPPGTKIYSCGDTNYIRRFYNKNAGQDSAFWNIDAGDSSGNMNCTGWTYTHINIWLTRDSIAWVYGDKIWHDTLLTRVIKFPATSRHHLHLERVYGDANPIDEYPPPTDWVDEFAIENPLDYLPSKTDTFKPKFCWFANDRPFLFRPDSIGTGSAFKKHLPSETLWVVSKKIDVLEYITDQTRSNNSSRSVAVDSVLYSIRSFNGSVQGWKGFTFRGAIGFKMNWSPDSLITVKVYCDSGAVFDYIYKPSNTDSLSDYFRSWGNEGWPCFTKITGWWNTKQHKDRAWDNANDAESLAVARFPDGYCWVLGKATDKAGNVSKDSIKVILNNFPPLVKQTYPVDGSAGVPRACTLRVWFDQPMDTVSAKAGFHLRLKNSTTDIPGTKWFYSGSDTFMLFKPDSQLLADTTYLMKDSTSTKDIADSAMTANHLVWFSTQRVDIHFSHSNNDSAWIEVRDTLFQTKRQFYAQASWPETTAVWGQKIVLDRAGNRYVCEDSLSNGVDRCAKFDTTGSLVATFLNGSRCRGITTDGDTLYVTTPHSADYINRVMRLNLNGDTLSSWPSPDSTFLDDISYSPETGKLFTLAWRVMYQGGWKVRNLTIKRYTRGGQLDTSRVVDIGGDLTNRPFRLTVGRDRVYLARSWYNRSGFPAGDTLAIYNWDLDLLGKITTRDTVTGPYYRINSLIADKEHLYVLLRSYNMSQYRYWVHVFTPAGSSLRMTSLTGGITGWESFGAIAVYPSILGVTGSEAAPGGGIGDGGSQSAGGVTLLPKVYALGQSYPNPGREGLSFDYALPKESQVSLRVYNVMGQQVRTLREGKEKPGFYKVEWDGKDQFGHRVSSGVFLYRMEAGEFRKTRKLVVLH